MHKFLVESAVAGRGSAGCTAGEWRARSAAAALRREGARIRFDRMLATSENGVCVFVFEAASRQEAARAAELAELEPMRVVELESSNDPAELG